MTDDSPKYRVTREGSGSYLIPPCESKIVAVVSEGRLINGVPSGIQCDLVLDHTPFFAEGGGQAGDEGTLSWGSANFKVMQTLSGSGYVLHRGVLGSGGLIRGDTVVACVDRRKRIGCMQHHTATHLIMAVLERFLGKFFLDRRFAVATSAIIVKYSINCACISILVVEPSAALYVRVTAVLIQK